MFSPSEQRAGSLFPPLIICCLLKLKWSSVVFELQSSHQSCRSFDQALAVLLCICGESTGLLGPETFEYLAKQHRDSKAEEWHHEKLSSKVKVDEACA